MCAASIVAGVAALVATGSFAVSLDKAIQDESKTLLGADLEFYSRQPFEAEAEELISTLGGEDAWQVAFGSMATFPQVGATRLVRVRALDGDYPFYGSLETMPTGADESFRTGRRALVENSLVIQFGVEVGEVVVIGGSEFTIAGRLMRIPGEVPSASVIAPRVLIPLQYVDRETLLGPGSRATYSRFLRLSDPEEEIVRRAEKIRPRLNELNVEVDSVSRRRRGLGSAVQNLHSFLYLAGLAAVLLGGIGVASCIHLYVRDKLYTAAVLRCLGARATPTLMVFCLQAAAVGLMGSLLGALLGLSIQLLVPAALSGILPVKVPFVLAPWAILQGFGVGLVVALLFALLPLLRVLDVAPLQILRAGVEPPSRLTVDRPHVLVGTAIALTVTALAVARSSWEIGLSLVGGMSAVLFALGGMAWALMKLVQHYFPRSWAYEWRQGLANLFRPHNQTLVVILSLGFGMFVVMSVYLVQASLVNEIGSTIDAGRFDLAFFDVQTDQVESVSQLLVAGGASLLEGIPVVTMRLAAVNQEPVSEVDEGPSPQWALRREYNSTYRSRLADTEELLEGEWIGRANLEEGTVPISLEEGIAMTLMVGVGDQLTFNVQGVLMPTRVASIRRVDWQQFSPNFFVVFPAGVLEPAPQMHVLLTHAGSTERSAMLQRQIIDRFPNVLGIDLGLVLNTIDQVLHRINLAIRFMALFSIAAGVIVLGTSVLSTRYERMRESVLLRILGASTAQVLQITTIEYLMLGTLAALTGLLLAIGGAWALVQFVFDVPLVASLPQLGLAAAAVTTVTVVVGVLNSRAAVSAPPLEVLRADAS